MTKNISVIALVLIGMMLLTSASQASVRALGKATIVKDSNGNSFKQVAVTCKSFSATRFLRQPASGGKWCDSVQPEFCASQQLKAATRVCSKRYMDSLADEEPKELNTKISQSNSAAEEESTSGSVTQSQTEVVAQPEVVGHRVEAEKIVVDENQVTLEEKRRAIQEERLKIKREQAELEQRKQQLLESKEALKKF